MITLDGSARDRQRRALEDDNVRRVEIGRDRPSPHHFIRHGASIRGGRSDSDALSGPATRSESIGGAVKHSI